MSLVDIRSALVAELEATPEHYDFKVACSERDGALWRVTVQPGAVYADGRPAQVVLDDSFDGASAWWSGPPKGSAQVLTVISDEDQLILRHATGVPPGDNGYIRLYPPRFLQGLVDGWRDTEWANRALACLDDLASPASVEANPLSGHAFKWLRSKQRRALKLVGYSSSFLWGPPGTGKTTVLGVLLAEYLYVNPRARVLLLSTTNHAVDQATLAVDKALETVGRTALRQTVKRIGTRFSATQYAGREHLLPVLDRDLIKRLANAEADRPSSTDIAAYSAWAERVDAIRTELKSKALAVLGSARLATMTTTRAAFTLQDLRALPPFDLVVFDEASQVSLAHALLLMPLGRARLFAGDPKQLSPVVRSTSKYAQRWLARSPFAEKPASGSSVCFLDEQSRMARPISEVVSRLFYDGELRVASDAVKAPEWHRDRAITLGEFGADQHFCLPSVHENGVWSHHYRGPIRFASAEWVAEFLVEVRRQGQLAIEDVIVLTPFRAQRALLRQRLSLRQLRGVKVSTVHRSQGSEARVVIFDPVDGASDFLRSDESLRLINVALSRAQAKLLVVLSPGDLENPLFAQIANRQRLAGDVREAHPIAELSRRAGFPFSAVGIRVAISRHVGEVSRVAADGTMLWMVNEQTGAEQCFDLAVVLGNIARDAT